jgi:hypothetical protein
MREHIIVISLLCLVVGGCDNRPTSIIFARKAFGDHEQLGWIYVAGTLAGSGLGYPNNTCAITCYKDRGTCFINQVWQIGPNQVGRLETPMEYPITKWNSYEIVATEPDSPVQCVKTTITIVRKSETVLWVQEPVNQTEVTCKDSDTALYKWTIEEPEWTKRHP